jgi:Cellulase (glycosyl hydrolase family 5)
LLILFHDVRAFLRPLVLVLLAAFLSASGSGATELAMALPGHSIAQTHEKEPWIKPTLGNRERLKGVTYFQNEWPYTFWDNLNLSHLDSDFKQIRSHGFNTIIVFVSWGSFQPTVYPVTYNERNFAKLIRLVQVAKENGLWVILRVATPEHVPSDLHRGQGAYKVTDTLYDQSQIRAIGTLYAELSKRLSSYPNVFGFFNSWEDFSGYFGYLNGSESDRLNFERRQGLFQKYLKARGNLDHWNTVWKTHYKSFDEIPLPAIKTRPLFDYLNFVTEQINTHVLGTISANRISQSVGYELRIDQDPVELDGKPFSYSYLDKLALPKEIGFVCAYYNPSWGAPPGKLVPPEFTEFALRRLLHNVLSAVGSKPTFFDQLNIADDTPAFNSNPKLAYPDGEIASVNKLVPMLFKDTIGYSLWTYKDYVGNVVQDGAFNGDHSPWLPKPRIVSARDLNCLELNVGSTVQQTVYTYFNPGSATTAAWRCNLTIANPANKSATIELWLKTQTGLTIHRVISMRPRETKDFEFQFPELKASAPCVISLHSPASNSAPVRVFYVSLWNHLMATGIVDRFGVDRASRAKGYKRVNESWLPIEQGKAVPNDNPLFLDRGKLDYYCVFDSGGWVSRAVEIPVYLPFPVGSISLECEGAKRSPSAPSPMLAAKWLNSVSSAEFTFKIHPGKNDIQIPCGSALAGDNMLLLRILRSGNESSSPAIMISRLGQPFPHVAFGKPFSGAVEFPIDGHTNRLTVKGKTTGSGSMRLWFAIGGHVPVKKEISHCPEEWQVSLPVDFDFLNQKPFLYIYAEGANGPNSCQITSISGESQRGPNDVFK